MRLVFTILTIIIAILCIHQMFNPLAVNKEFISSVVEENLIN
jgi:hypothetical protein